MLQFITKLLRPEKTILSVPTKQSIGSIFGTTFSKNNFDIAFSSISYACMKLRADAVSSLKYNIYYNYGNGEKEIVEPSHWFNKLLLRPNATNSFKSLLRLVQMWLDYNGNAYIYMANNGYDTPVNMYVLQSDNVTIKMGEYGPTEYTYNYGGKIDRYHPSEIIHIKNLLPGFNPIDDFIGRSLIKSAVDLINADVEFNSYIKRHFANDTIPPYILKSDHELEDSQIQHFVTKWNQKLPQHKMMGALSGGLEAIALSSANNNPVTLEASNKILMEKIAIIFGIPFQKLTGSATSMASAQVSDFSFRMDTIEPLAFEIVSSINLFLKQYDTYLEIDFEEFNYVDNDSRLKQEDQDIRNNVVTINEIRSSRGLEPVPWGNGPVQTEN